MKYKIVSSVDINELEKRVNDAINDGWLLYEQPFVIHPAAIYSRICQVVVFYD